LLISGSFTLSHESVTVPFDSVTERFEILLNLANLSETVPGSVPRINNSLILNSLGVYSLGRVGSGF
jgi:hypothetical protein